MVKLYTYIPGTSYYELKFEFDEGIELLADTEYWLGFSLGNVDNNVNANIHMIGGFTSPLYQSYNYNSQQWNIGAAGTVYTLYGESVSVPEPTTGILLGLGLFTLLANCHLNRKYNN